MKKIHLISLGLVFVLILASFGCGQTHSTTTTTTTTTTSTTTTTMLYSISGTVASSDATAISGATIALSGTSTEVTTTGATGTYEFSSLIAGTYYLTPTVDGYSLLPVSREVVISNSSTTEQNFTGTFIGYSISGTITYPGQAAPLYVYTYYYPLTTAHQAVTPLSSQEISASSYSVNYTINNLSNGTYVIVFADVLTGQEPNYIGMYGWSGVYAISCNDFLTYLTSISSQEPITIEGSSVRNIDISTHAVNY